MDGRRIISSVEKGAHIWQSSANGIFGELLLIGIDGSSSSSSLLLTNRAGEGDVQRKSWILWNCSACDSFLIRWQQLRHNHFLSGTSKMWQKHSVSESLLNNGHSSLRCLGRRRKTGKLRAPFSPLFLNPVTREKEKELVKINFKLGFSQKQAARELLSLSPFLSLVVRLRKQQKLSQTSSFSFCIFSRWSKAPTLLFIPAPQNSIS